MIKRIAALSLLLLSTTALAQDKKDEKKWDVMAPPGLKMRQVPINVSEGTWMNLDVSPDGRTIAFDLLGDIYTMPIGGGRATRIAAGMAYETQPRFSPDGRQIAFTSDRGGGENIWLMGVDGSTRSSSPRRPSASSTTRPGARTAASSRRASISRRSVRPAPARSGCTMSPAARAWRWSSGPTRNSRRNWASRCSRRTAPASISAAT
jgi:Tol biopolymer transport system component